MDPSASQKKELTLDELFSQEEFKPTTGQTVRHIEDMLNGDSCHKLEDFVLQDYYGVVVNKGLFRNTYEVFTTSGIEEVYPFLAFFDNWFKYAPVQHPFDSDHLFTIVRGPQDSMHIPIQSGMLTTDSTLKYGFFKQFGRISAEKVQLAILAFSGVKVKNF